MAKRCRMLRNFRMQFSVANTIIFRSCILENSFRKCDLFIHTTEQTIRKFRTDFFLFFILFISIIRLPIVFLESLTGFRYWLKRTVYFTVSFGSFFYVKKIFRGIIVVTCTGIVKLHFIKFARLPGANFLNFSEKSRHC